MDAQMIEQDQVSQMTGTSLPMWRQLRWTMIAFFVLLAVIPTVVVVVITLDRMRAQAETQAINQLESVATLKQREIQSWLNDSLGELRTVIAGSDRVNSLVVLARGEATAEQRQEVWNRLLFQAIDSYNNFDSFFFYNLDGLVLTSSDVVNVGKIVTRQPYYEASLTSSHIQPPYYDAATSELTLIVSIPLEDPISDTVVGVIAGKLNLDTLGALMVERAGLGDTGETYLVSAESNYLLTPSRFAGYVSNQAYHSEGIDRALAGENGSGIYGSYRAGADPVAGVYRWIPEIQAALLAEFDQAEALSTFTQAQRQTALFTALTALIAAGFGLLVATLLSRPVIRLTQTVTQLAGGDLTQRVPVGMRNEFGLLSQAFNSMAGQLQGLVGALEDRVQARTRDLFLTLEVGQFSTRDYQQPDFLPSILDFIHESFDLYYAQVYLLDDTQRFAVLSAGTTDVGQQLLEQGHRLDLRETSIVARAAQARQPVLVQNTDTSDVFLPNALLPETRSEVSIPLIAADQVLGVLDLQASVADTFTAENLPVFEAMASQLAAAIQNAQSYHDTQAAVERAAMINRRLTGEAWTGYLGRLSEGQHVGFAYDLQTVQPLVAPLDVEKDAGVVGQVQLRGQPIGKVLVHDGGSRAWSNEDRELIDDVAERVALAVEQFRAADETARLASEMQNVAELSTEISGTLDPTVLLKSVANLTKERFGHYHAHIYLIDPAQERLLLAAGAGAAGDMMVASKHSIPIEHPASLVARAARSRRTVVANDVTGAKDFLPNPLLPQTRSEMAIPLIAGEQVLGVLDVQADRINRFTEQDIQTHSTLAAQVAIAVRTARLFAYQSATAAQRAALNEISLAVVSENDPLRIFEIVVEALVERFNMAFARIWTLDRARANLVLRVSAGEYTHIDGPHGIVSLDSERKLAWIAKQRVPYINNDLMNDQRLDNREWAIENEMWAFAGYPLFSGNQLLGILGMFSHETISDDTLGVLQSLAVQIGSLITNQQLLEQTQRRAAEMAAVAEVGAEVSSELELQRLLHNVANVTKDRFGLYHAHIYLLNDTRTDLVLAAGAGQVGEHMVAAGHRIPISRENSLVAQAARSHRAVVVNNVVASPGYLPNPLLPRTRSEMALPMIVGDQVIGVLDVQSDQADNFAEQDVQVHATLASQVAVAVQNAQLYAEQVAVTDQLREVDRLKSEFLASMSHELRTPLNSIIGYAEVLLDGIDGELNADMEEDVGAIHGSGKHLLSLINDVLDLAKIEAGQMDLVREHFRIKPVLEDMVNTSRVLVKNKAVKIIVDVPDDLPEVDGDQLRVRQIINNLVSNAAKFTDQGNIIVAARIYDEQPDRVVISVRDSGIGMTEDQVQVIFDRFRQVDQSHTRRAGGTGLGLSITRELVELHGGELWVDSEFGHGSTFSFSLPVVGQR